MREILSVLTLALILLSGLSAPAAAQETADTPVFAPDIAVILQENCQVCHQPGAIGPMSFMSYEETRPWAPIIKEKVVTQEMPPYHYDTNVGIQELKSDARLSAEEIATIVAWVDAGAPSGDLNEMPPPVVWPDAAEWRMAERFGQPDLVIRSDPYDIPATGGDSWWEPMVDTGITEERCIMAIETKPSVAGRPSTHHANSQFQVWNEEAGEYESFARLSEYALGKLGEIIPEGACRKAPTNSVVTWDIHYYPMGEAVPGDQVEVGLWLYPEDYAYDYEQDLRLYPGEGDIDLAPHGTAMTQGFHSFDHPVRIDSWQPHGHFRLAAASLEIFHPATGERDLISMVSNWTAVLASQPCLRGSCGSAGAGRVGSRADALVRQHGEQPEQPGSDDLRGPREPYDRRDVARLDRDHASGPGRVRSPGRRARGARGAAKHSRRGRMR